MCQENIVVSTAADPNPFHTSHLMANMSERTLAVGTITKRRVLPHPSGGSAEVALEIQMSGRLTPLQRNLPGLSAGGVPRIQ
jgi:hypothetical protein